MSARKFKQGDVIGLLTIDHYDEQSKKWCCKCACGNTVYVLTYNLTKPHGTRSCGCYRRQDLTGKKLGKLLVVERMRKNGKTFYRCQCDCGNETTVVSYSLTDKKHPTRSCGKCGLGDAYREQKQRECFVVGTQPAKIKLDKTPPITNKSGFIGVCWNKRSNKWMSYITFQSVKYYLGCYTDIRDAVAARKEAEQEVFGDFIKWYQKYKEHTK